MEIKKRKEITLYNIFLKYLVRFCLFTFLSLFLSLLIFMFSINKGIVLPASYAQNNIEELKKEILSSEDFDKNNINYPYSYVYYDKKLNLISSNLNENKLNEAYKFLIENNSNTNDVYKKIELKNGICILSYDIKAHFSSEYLDNILPYPEIIMIILFFILFITFSITLIGGFGKRLKKELNPIKKSTQLIMKHDLDFEIEATNIKEFNEVLISIENMKIELRKSLEEQWKSEQKKRDQIAALAHDIKTPLTIIKGNAELLLEFDSENKNNEYINYIIRNTDKIEDYISLLIDISKTESNINYTMESIEFNEFLKEIESEINMMCIRKNIKSLIKVYYSPKTFKANKGLLIRALNNLVINSIDYSNEGETIEFIINGNNNELKFIVKDCGLGFTKEGLKNATNQFYMEKSERKAGKHYGIGLYIAQTVAKKHNGEVLLKNREDRQGAEVTLTIKLD